MKKKHKGQTSSHTSVTHLSLRPANNEGMTKNSIHTQLHFCTHSHTHSISLSFFHTHTHTYTHHAQARSHTHTHAHTHTCSHTHMLTHTHAHTGVRFEKVCLKCVHYMTTSPPLSFSSLLLSLQLSSPLS